MSTMLDDLRRSFGAPPAERDTGETYDLALVRALDPLERDELARELAARVPLGDTRAMMTLAEIGGPIAVAALEPAALQPNANGVTARRALAFAAGTGGIAPSSPVVPLLVADLRGGTMVERFGAAMAVARTGLATPEVIEALLDAMDHDDAALRAKAFEVWVQVLGLARFCRTADDSDVELRAPLMVYEAQVRSRLRALRAPALADLRRLASALASAQSPDALAIGYVPATAAAAPADLSGLGRTLFDNPRPIPVDAVRAASGADRRWAEVLIAKSLERHLPKAAAALADLGARWAVPVMQEAAAEAQAGDAFAQAVADAVARL